MSWRLERRDLSGEWVLNDQDERDLISAIKERESLSQITPRSLADLRLFLRERGEQWLRVWSQSQLGLTNPFLGPRLEVVRQLHPQDTFNVDIGTDHAHLPISLVRSGVCPYAIGIDVAQSPLKIAHQEVMKASLEGRIALICGDGLSPLMSENGESIEPSLFTGEIAEVWERYKSAGRITVSICGVGGLLAAKLISELPPWIGAMIVQANDHPEALDQAFGDLTKLYDERALRVEATIERNRLFITKRMLRKDLSITAKVDQDLGVDKSRRSHLLGIWRWVQLSRSMRRVSLTPDDHPSIVEKRQALDLAILRFFRASFEG